MVLMRWNLNQINLPKSTANIVSCRINKEKAIYEQVKDLIIIKDHLSYISYQIIFDYNWLKSNLFLNVESPKDNKAKIYNKSIK